MEQRKRNTSDNNTLSPSSSTALSLGGFNSNRNSNSSITKHRNNNKSKHSSDSLSSMSSICEKEEYENKIEIRIKSNVQNSKNNGNKKDVTISIATSSTVNQLKDEIRNRCFNNEECDHNSGRTMQIGRDRYLRLICSGRLLAPDSTRLSEFNCVKDGAVVHAVLAAPGVRGGQQAALSRDSSSRRQSSNNQRRFGGIGVGIGSNGLILPRRSNDNDDDEEEDIEEGRERRGFDRLRANGMSRNEIAAVRTYFSRRVDRFIEQRNELNQNTENENEDPRLYRLRMEDEWMDRQGPYSEFRLNTNTSNMNSSVVRSRAFINGLEIDTTTGEINSDFRSQTGSSIIGALGTNRDLVWGFVFGYSFGFMTMFFLWLPTVPHKQRVGILSGFCFHMMMRILERGSRLDV